MVVEILKQNKVHKSIMKSTLHGLEVQNEDVGGFQYKPRGESGFPLL